MRGIRVPGTAGPSGFCPSCGLTLARRAPRAGALTGAGARFPLAEGGGVGHGVGGVQALAPAAGRGSDRVAAPRTTLPPPAPSGTVPVASSGGP